MSQSPFERPVSALVVDTTDDSIRTAEVLSASNCCVDVVTRFEDAADALARRAPDVLITESRLYDYNGLHLIMRLRATDPSAVGVVLTSFPDRVLEREAQKLGAAYLVKPLAPASLFRAVSDGLSRRVQNVTSALSHLMHPSWGLTGIRPVD